MSHYIIAEVIAALNTAPQWWSSQHTNIFYSMHWE